jgi:hypothetical protein
MGIAQLTIHNSEKVKSFVLSQKKFSGDPYVASTGAEAKRRPRDTAERITLNSGRGEIFVQFKQAEEFFTRREKTLRVSIL